MSEPRVSGQLAGILSGMVRDIARGPGPVKWCKRCGRKHGRRAPCELVDVLVPAKSNRMVKRKVHRSRAEP